MFDEIRAQGPFFTLFVTLVLLLIIAPITQSGRLGGALLQGGYTMVLLASVWGVRTKAPDRAALWVVGIPALAVGCASSDRRTLADLRHVEPDVTELLGNLEQGLQTSP